ncbi:MAG: metallophosphoesterase family protein [Gammaproteobacteria bacterium]|nr:metallophosphoesterase family protein [Gammaproteobacteria bacterium]
MKICIVSDSHDNRTMLTRAVSEAKAWGATAVIHCGDVVSPTGRGTRFNAANAGDSGKYGKRAKA